MKVCVIGSSHSGALKKAWDKKDSFLNMETFFFSSEGGTFRSRDVKCKSNLNIEDGCLYPQSVVLKKNFIKSSGGRSFVDVSVYDAFIVMGINFDFPLLRVGLSSKVRASVVTDKLGDSVSFDIVDKIRRLSDAPLLVVPRPLYPEGHCRASKEEFDVEDFKETLSLLGSVYEGFSATFVSPPAKALTSDCKYTRSEFRSEVTSNPEKSRLGQAHMNVDYGELVLEEVCEILGVTQVG